MKTLSVIILMSLVTALLVAPVFLIVLRERFRPYQLAMKDGVADKNFVLAGGVPLEEVRERVSAATRGSS